MNKTRALRANPLRAVALWTAVALLTGFAFTVTAAESSDDWKQTLFELRPPAAPLVACDPYFSIWSQSDTLNGAGTTHWTGKPHRMTSMLRIDGKAWRVMGVRPDGVPAMTQTRRAVAPTTTFYAFEADGVELMLTFTTPAIPYHDLDLITRPVTYLTYTVRSTDGKAHDVQLYFDAAAEIAVNTQDQEIDGAVEKPGDLIALKIGSTEQNILGKSGDDIRIDWGYFYLAGREEYAPTYALALGDESRAAFLKGGAKALTGLRTDLPAPAEPVVGAMAMDLGTVQGDRPVQRFLVLAYDQIYAIQYMKKNLRPYWRRNGWDAADLLEAASAEYTSIQEQCQRFDVELMHYANEVGGAQYAAICALAYRQALAAGKFVADENGQPLQFSKENHSNGCIATSDVFYPMAPQFLLLGPDIAKSFIVPFMNYAASERWKFPFAPHDLGTYPHANGQRYGGGETSEENQMPVEECGNLLLLMGAVSKMEGHAEFASLYWTQLTQWAEYLKSKGFDPENQLCTDDFAGHLAHNVNLSAKAIVALGAYAKMCEMRQEWEAAAEYRKIAQEFAARWVKEAKDGDHYRLAFDREGTWSQKYNLVWDKILGLGLFPDHVKETEMAFYRKIQNEYGLPLDNRSTYTKLDWILWTATLTQKREDFEALVDPVYQFLNDTPDRSPMTDWYFTDTAKKRGFTARPVVGGVFLQMLYHDDIWKKFASRCQWGSTGWAPMPTPPKTETIVPTSQEKGIVWRYTMERPGAGWSDEAFDDSGWKEGPGGFGTRNTPGAVVGTIWDTQDIWIRRTFELKAPLPKQPVLRLHHDEDAQIYINGKLVRDLGGFTTGYDAFEFNADVLRVGKNTIAIHVRQTSGGQYIDCGIDVLVPVEPKAKQGNVTVVKNIDASHHNDHYVSNRAPLQPSALIPLPVGAVQPGSWVRAYLERQRDGLTGNLGRISAWLQKDGNAWLSKDGQGDWGWEELPYWLKGYCELGYILGDEAMIAESQIWIEAALRSQRANGDFGPDQRFGDGTRDYWANMIMLFCLQSYYDYSGDQRVLDLMSRYFKYQSTVPDDEMLTGYWQRMRGGDNLYSILWLYNRTGEAWLLDVAHKIHRNTADWRMKDDLPNWHNVNIAQAFGEPGTYYLVTGEASDLKAAYANFFEIRKRFGQVPGGMWGGDENSRPGYDDPRQMIETCGSVEQMLSNETLLAITGDRFWADHCEEVAFNTYPAATMPDFRSLRYLTGPNMVVSDRENHSPGIQNGGPFLIMNPFSSRCCQHNHSHGWPYYAKSLWMATPDNGIAATLYAGSRVKAKVGDGVIVTIDEITHYPFESRIVFDVETPKAVTWPLYLRIPGWSRDVALQINNEAIAIEPGDGQWIRIEREWFGEERVVLELPMEISVRRWEKNHNSATVDYGPLTLSLKIGERYDRFDSTETAIGDSKWQAGVNTDLWPSWEIHPTTPWNYGLVFDESNPADSFTVTRRAWPQDDFPFTLEAAPIVVKAKGRKIPNWKLDRYGLCDVLQDSPVKSEEPVENIELIPMGAARLRISAFPVIGSGPEATEWQAPQMPKPPKYKVTVSHKFDSPEAMCDDEAPANSNDHSVERFTWWDHKGSVEWVQYDFKAPRELTSTAVYWFDDTGVGECRAPESWRLLYKDGDDWKPVETADAYGVARDRFNSVAFKPVKTDAVRLEAKLRPNYSGGILEWTVE